MKKTLILLATGLLVLGACSKNVTVKNPITISSPTPTVAITKVDLNETQKGYVQAGNAMAFRFLKQLYQGKNLVCSPLSLQYALAMTANGASGETLQEIIDFLEVYAAPARVPRELPHGQRHHGRQLRFPRAQCPRRTHRPGL